MSSEAWREVVEFAKKKANSKALTFADAKALADLYRKYLSTLPEYARKGRILIVDGIDVPREKLPEMLERDPDIAMKFIKVWSLL